MCLSSLSEILQQTETYGTVAGSKTHSKKKNTYLSATQHPGLPKCNFEIKTHLFLLFLDLSQSLCGRSQGTGFHDDGAINTAQETPMKNSQPSPLFLNIFENVFVLAPALLPMSLTCLI